jgi:hypothetical protein
LFKISRTHWILLTIASSVITFVLLSSLLFRVPPFQYPVGYNIYIVVTVWILTAINIIIRSYFYPK